ncbi:glycosyltransferase involved in cell wall biosynthesis [Mariniflexile fucanivorans]|uniref:Glycosyltransferase involved in cell wall biosynthesis n=1 Tax=Mariniflexile fucanivorans TaxID=264023 RepID=A0A4R1RKI3_9FLAO|nr:glycosyltransferase [Mariniflexile fucanivorans]TCL66698.1 glycosyltransferase involved in cell wall biosynthesis [Mariniflexile fucanivorans]
MKIIFICGSLEPGKDGVGDYTRRLCAELILQGIHVGILSYNDKDVNGATQVTQYADGQAIYCYRISTFIKPKERCVLAKQWIDTHNPEWLSLQFVPYAFNNKGLPFGFASQLKTIGQNRKWHIMFHELWIGMNKESTLKEKCIGYIQRYIIKELTLKLKPNLVNTQTELYKKQLEKLTITSSLLPLFSNIPVIQKPIEKTHLDSIPFDIPNKYFVLFGSIHYGSPINHFVKDFVDYLKNDSFSLITIGRNGNELREWISIWESYKLEVKCLGEQSVEVISHVLKNATFGISTTPMALVEKSGSVLAMHAHGIPVICMSRPWTPLGIKNDWAYEGITEYKLGEIAACMECIENINPEKNNVHTIALSLIKKLKNN